MKKNMRMQWGHRALALMLALLLLVQAVPFAAVHAAEEGQIETAAAEGNVQVSSPDQLLSGVPAGSTYELTDNITLGAGQMIPEVAGVLDGKGYTITLTDRPLSKKITGTVQNLGVTSTGPVKGPDEGFSNPCGSITVELNGGKLYNCWSTATVAEVYFDALGGLAYKALEGAELYNCFFAGKLEGMLGKGGLVYNAEPTGRHLKAVNCYFVNDQGVTKGIGIGAGFDAENSSMTGLALDAMKTSDFADKLNMVQLGKGYVWQAVEGDFPKLVPGGEIIKPADLEQLKAAIQDAESKLESNYTEESWAKMQEALKTAKEVAEKNNVKQDEVDRATEALNTAIRELQEKKQDSFPVELPKDGVIEIRSAQDFSQIDQKDPDKAYRLMQDIVIEDGFNPPELVGIFDGAGHTITIQTDEPLFRAIKKTGVVQNLHVRVDGAFTNRYVYAPYAQYLSGGMIVNCISEVTGQHSTGFVENMSDGVIANCLTMGHNRRGAFVYFQKSTDHANSNGYRGGKIFNSYWSASNSVENILEIAPENMIDCAPAGDEELRSDEFLQLLNKNKGQYGVSWGRDAQGYPYFGQDQGEHVIDGSQNLYPVEFAWHNGDVTEVENGILRLSPQMTDSNRFAGTFRLKGVPADSTIVWDCQDRAQREVVRMDDDRLFIYFDGGAVVTATEHKADGSQQVAAQLRVISASQTIEELRLVLDGQVIDGSATIQGSADQYLGIQAKYKGSNEFKPMPPYLVELTAEKTDMVHVMYNTGVFYFSKPGTSNLTVTPKYGGPSVTVSITSEYVPITSIKPGISGIQKIHGRNSMGNGEFNDIPLTVSVEPANASYKHAFVVESSNKEIAQFGGRAAYIAYKAGTVTFTAKADNNGTPVEGTSEVTFVYENPLVSVTAPTQKVSVKVGEKTPLGLKFEGENTRYAAVSEPELVWTYSKDDIVDIYRPNLLMQIRDTDTEDRGDWVASSEYVLKALKPGTVQVTGTPVDTTGGAKPVTFTVTVTGDEGDASAFDISKFIAQGKEAAIHHLMEKNNYSFGQEWNIYAMLRDGQSLPQDKLDDYYASVAATVKSWKPTTNPTEIERAVLALSILDKDITNIEGVNLVDMICNHPNLTRQGSNALIWGLIALDLKNTPVPAGAKWTRESMVNELLTYQKEDGSFGLDKNAGSSLDVTAMAIQALAYYQEMDGVQEAVERGVAYMAKVAEKNLDYGSAESISQAIIALSVLDRDLVEEPGFGDKADNLMSALSLYMVENQGFKHAKGQGVNTMATVQAMQALCAYERFLNGESGYWDLLGNRPSFDPVAKVIEMIDRLPETITLDDAAAVRAAREAFDALRPEQQKRVTNVDKLEAAEEAIRNMSQDEKEALEVMALIDAIGEVTLDSQAKIETARAAYDALTEAQKALVSNYATLEAAEEALRIWQLPKADTEKAYKTTGDYLEGLAKNTAPIVNSVGGEWLVLGLVRDGREVPAGYYENVLKYVTEKINDKEQLNRSKSSDNSRVILALTAIGKDVTDVAGHNLLRGISDMKYLKKQGINGPIWALIAFDSHSYEIPAVYEGGEQVTREGLIQYVLDTQLSDGGWALSGTNSGPDMTAMAIQSLAPYYKSNEKVKTAIDTALETLSKVQNPDGSFGSWGITNSESSAQVIVALTSLGIDPNTDARFVKNGRSVVNALCDFYVEDGGFKHTANGERDGMASEQGYCALVSLNRLVNGKTRLYDMNEVNLEKPVPFTDVPKNQWYYGYVSYVYHNNLMNGISDTTFAPEKKMTRGQLVTVLYRMAGSPQVEGNTPFTDLEKGRYYVNAVIWASKNGIANGITSTTFGPNKLVTREQMATFFARYAKMKGADMTVSADLSGFVDYKQVSNYAEKTMQWAVGTKLIQGVGKDTLRPRGDATRAQAAAMLQRLDLLLKG